MRSLIYFLCVIFVFSVRLDVFAFDDSSSAVARNREQVLRKLGNESKLGLNLAGVCDWNTELPFVDVFLETRRWISQQEGKSWGEGPELELDERGWVRHLEDGCWVEVPLCTIDGGNYPSGIYTVTYEGKGQLAFNGARVVSEKQGTTLIDVDSQHGAFWLRITATDPSDYIRNIHVYLPNFGSSDLRAENGIWNPDFLERWKSMKVFRTMDWQATNGSKLRKWSDRPQVEDATYTKSGLPIEIISDFINRTDADLWFCIPDQADDDFVRRTAQLLKEQVNSEKLIYLEYSNEVWNSSFEQSRRASEKGKALKIGESDWEAAWHYTARRSIEIFTIFEEVWGSTDRLVRVLPTQAVNPFVSEQILQFDDAWRHADALAIAPYFGMSVPKEDVDEVIALGVDGMLKKLEKEILPETIDAIKKQKEVADRYGLKLVCYEAGQHLVGLWGANDSEELNRILMSVNRSERMGELYDRYYRAWEELGGGTLCHFSSVGKWTKWGSWGLIEYATEMPEDSPKYRVTLEYAKRWNCK